MGSVCSQSTVTEDDENNPELAEEARVMGKMGWSVYRNYFKASRSFFMVFFSLVLLIATQVCVSLADWWGSKWYVPYKTNVTE